jgi:hypothetical protein
MKDYSIEHWLPPKVVEAIGGKKGFTHIVLVGKESGEQIWYVDGMEADRGWVSAAKKEGNEGTVQQEQEEKTKEGKK